MKEKLNFKNQKNYESKEEKEMKEEVKFKNLKMYENEEEEEMETEKPICNLCGEVIEGWTYNPAPIISGVCCDLCNDSKVIPARIGIAYIIEERLKELEEETVEKVKRREANKIERMIAKEEERVKKIMKEQLHYNKKQVEQGLKEMMPRKREIIEAKVKDKEEIEIAVAVLKAKMTKKKMIERQAIMHFQRMYGII